MRTEAIYDDDYSGGVDPDPRPLGRAVFLSGGEDCPDGIVFATEPGDPVQVAVMRRAEAAPHLHPPVRRELRGTPDVMLVRSGRVWADVYNARGVVVWRKVLRAGDILVLFAGGHGFRSVAGEGAWEAVEVKVGEHLPEDKVPL